MVMLEIELCGRLADMCGRRISVTVPQSGVDVAGLFATIGAGFAPLAEPLASGRVKACVNDVIVSRDHLVRPEDAVALFPPVSGG